MGGQYVKRFEVEGALIKIEVTDWMVALTTTCQDPVAKGDE